TMISPGLTIAAQPSGQRYALSYKGDIARYAVGSTDNYDDHFFNADAYLPVGARGELEVKGSFEDAHDDRGSNLTDGFDPASNNPPIPHEHQQGTILGTFSYGISAKGRIVVEAGVSDLEYTNDQNRTRFFDRKDRYGGAGFHYAVMPKTTLIVDARLSTFDYENNRLSESSLDSEESRYQLGVQWDATAQITGTAKIGYTKKNFDAADRGEFSNTSWGINLRWSPRTYSHFDFETARHPSESNGGGNFIDNTSYSFSWEHEWRDRLRSRVVARYLDQDYLGSTTNRNQQQPQYIFSINYKMRNWLEWNASAELNSRDSNFDQLVFDGNIFRIGAVISR
ncbi:MAG: outer membrane beta-barrel protein, partial [Gammaproteobacteria bacterium]|nr:outer membrane beta-barrel protein [Gammaproteobacteria bacterium]